MAFRLLDICTECSLQICIGKPCGSVRPFMVGHNDNVFLTGLAQQAIQQEISKKKICQKTYAHIKRVKAVVMLPFLTALLRK